MKKNLAKGYTTGTCAQAAAKAAVSVLFGAECPEEVIVTLPGGEEARLKVEKIKRGRETETGYVSVRCAVRKDSGDDPDVTDGVLVYCTVSRTEGTAVVLDGGRGIGRVTKKGLDQPVGSAAINRVPRQMILREITEARERAGYRGGLLALVEIPGGEELAKKTFNPRIGIEGGLSILGTTGIVEPMSRQALVDTIEVEMRVKMAQGHRILLAAPGNYGLDFLEETEGISEREVIKCSNFVGETVDLAVDREARALLFAAHIGKFVKVAGGIMNTHSREADCRMELLAAAAVRGNAGLASVKRILEANTTEEALSFLSREEREETVREVIRKICEYLNYRAEGRLEIGVMLFSSVYGCLGASENAGNLLEEYRKEREQTE